MTASYRTAELESYLDEALPVEEMTRIETALRDDPRLAAAARGSHRPAGQRPDVAGRNLASASAELPKPARAWLVSAGRSARRCFEVFDVSRQRGGLPLLRGQPGRLEEPASRAGRRSPGAAAEVFPVQRGKAAVRRRRRRRVGQASQAVRRTSLPIVRRDRRPTIAVMRRPRWWAGDRGPRSASRFHRRAALACPTLLRYRPSPGGVVY